MWRQQQPAARVKVAWTTLDAAETTQAWLVVDGQQRVTALAGALSELSGRERAEARPWQLYFDTRNEEFVSGTPREADRESCVPMVTLGDLRRLGRWARDCDPDATAFDRAEEAQKRILDYEIPPLRRRGERRVGLACRVCANKQHRRAHAGGRGVPCSLP
jgi:hypothetical protein